MGAGLLTQRRLGTLVNELDSMGLVNAKVVSMGRYGRTKKIRLEISRSLIRDVFSSDNRFNRLIEYSPQTSRKSPSSIA
jgi:cell division control protein 6